LRRVSFKDAETGIRYFFLTNNFQPAAGTIAEIYKARWQIELFFKWIKQNLEIKNFYGTSRDAVMTQIRIAVCVCLLLAQLEYVSKIGGSLVQIFRLFQHNLFERRDLQALLRDDPPDPNVSTLQAALRFS
jgi:putative transposase